MKKAIAVCLLTLTGIAFAACPSYAPYGCTQGAIGKMMCGCGR
jgi:hypothetical protein